ncbi:DUF2269 family protein [Egibacter rhizosphaerae]|uniref:DUF2269 family protein n=1 Tax=Egibacter rhizosphaerae TaxID=1670831 RepID=UPI0013F15C0F|nr:DUF2269 family protein [Egibacter rhizosphaerae]
MIDLTSLFLHVLAAIGLVAGGLAQVMAGSRLRTAESGSELLAWTRFTRTAGWLVAASAALSLLTGGHLAGAVWGGEAGGFANPFITLGLVGLIVLVPIGPAVGERRFRRLAEAAAELGESTASERLHRAARSPALWGPVHSLVGVGVGQVALMVYKPGWLVGALVLVLTFAAGWVAGSAVAARSAPAAHG